MEVPRPARVKNKTPAPIQITADHLLREARELQEPDIRPPKQSIADPVELSDYRIRKRREFEDQIRRGRNNAFVSYGFWEESQGEFDRARSVFERALEADHRNPTFWLKYAQFEMRNKFIGHARNVFDRGVTLLPRVDKLWYEFIHLEEKAGDFGNVRLLFERWMRWQPDTKGWSSYVRFEIRCREFERARKIYERFVDCHPRVSEVWIDYAKFERKKAGDVAKARAVFERAAEVLMEDEEEAEAIFVAFAEFEESNKELERARGIYKYALDHIPQGRAEDLCRKFVEFEKRYGDSEGIEDVIVAKRRFQYAEEVRKNPFDYDSWFDYIRLEESVGNKDKIREVYKRAIDNVPPVKEKRYWRRYIYLW